MESRVHNNQNWIQALGDIYHDQVFKTSHPVIMSWPMVGRDWPALLVVFCYVLFINYLGPALMRNRKPFDLRWLMVPYNIVLVIANFYIFIEFARIWFSGGASAKCETLNFNLKLEDNPNMYRMAKATWYFYITKYVELFDTIFFVLRKKDRQLSGLHKIHHSTVPIMVGLMLRSSSGGYNSFFPLANSFVHCIMYTYYGVSAMGDHVTIHLKFKKYITMTQMIQFILVITHFISLPFFGCHWNPYFGYGNLTIAGFFFVLFCNFYWHEYQIRDKGDEQNGHAKQKNM